MHINSISTLGPNHWYEEGDRRFHPITLFSMPEIPTFWQSSVKKQEKSFGASDLITMRMKRRKNWAGLSASTIYI